MLVFTHIFPVVHIRLYCVRLTSLKTGDVRRNYLHNERIMSTNRLARVLRSGIALG